MKKNIVRIISVGGICAAISAMNRATELDWSLLYWWAVYGLGSFIGIFLYTFKRTKTF